MKRKRALPCLFCDGCMRPGRVTVDQRRGGKLVVVEGVPALVCERCGHRYYHARVIRKLQRLLETTRRARRNLKVPVLQFDAVA